jgi:hypothetical protein
MTARLTRNPRIDVVAASPHMGVSKSAKGIVLGFIQECQNPLAHPKGGGSDRELPQGLGKLATISVSSG